MSLSDRSTPSPLVGVTAVPVDETKMPQGHCRYILMVPEIKGQRCACVNFTLNMGIPGSTCECGHLACFHTKEPETSAEQKQELDVLKRRIRLLEEQMSRGHDDEVDAIRMRLTEVEEQVDRSKEETREEFKRSYQNVSLSWQSIDKLQRRNQQYDAQFSEVDARLGAHSVELKRLDERAMELADADASLEERLDEAIAELEDDDGPAARGRDRRPRRRSTSDTSAPNHPLGPLGGPLGGGPLDAALCVGAATTHLLRRSSVSRPLIQGLGAGNASAGPTLMSSKALQTPVPPSGTWTVHISLLPQADAAMPFERNTAAYQRCLSRGLHRMVAVNGSDARSFTTAVSNAFGSLLRGREWMPLQAKLCDAEQLQGLPMLRQLDPPLVNCQYDAEFLRKHCAVCDPNGIMDSLYIAMKKHTLSWHDLKQAPVFMDGLESSWEHDLLLDSAARDDDAIIDDANQPAAGDIVALSSTLKRTAQELSRSNSFGASGAHATDSESSRAKRACPPPPKSIPGIRRRGVETI